MLQPTNKLQRGRGGGRREGERESVPAIIYVLFVFLFFYSPVLPLPPTVASFFEKMRTVAGGERWSAEQRKERGSAVRIDLLI